MILNVRPSVMACEVFHVLQHERFWLVKIDDFGDGKKQVSLFFILEAVLFAEAEFL